MIYSLIYVKNYMKNSIVLMSDLIIIYLQLKRKLSAKNVIFLKTILWFYLFFIF